MTKFFTLAGKALFILNFAFSLHAMNESNGSFSENEKLLISNNQLLQAVLKDDVDDVQRCIDGGAHINCIEKWGMFFVNPLITAVLRNKSEAIIQFLLDKGADVNICYPHNKKTPIAWAVRLDLEKSVSMLIKYNADLTKKDSDGNTLLMLASEMFSTRAGGKSAIPCMLVEEYLRMPSKEQRKKIVTLLCCLKRKSFSKDIVQCIKPFVLDVVSQENSLNVKSRAYQEIRKIKNIDLKIRLLSKYKFPKEFSVLFEDGYELDEDQMSCCIFC